MNATDLDRLYTALSEALGRVGEERASLFLATLALDLIATINDPSTASTALERAERLSAV